MTYLTLICYLNKCKSFCKSIVKKSQFYIQETYWKQSELERLKIKGWVNVYHINTNEKKWEPGLDIGQIRIQDKNQSISWRRVLDSIKGWNLHDKEITGK